MTDVADILTQITAKQDETFDELKALVEGTREIAQETISKVWPTFDGVLQQWDPYMQMNEAQTSMQDLLSAAPEIGDFQKPDAPPDPTPVEILGVEELQQLTVDDFDGAAPTLDFPTKPELTAAEKLDDITFPEFTEQPPTLNLPTPPTMTASEKASLISIPTFTKAPPPVQFPQVPSLSTPAAPAEPALNFPALPEAPSYSLPQVPPVSSIFIPPAPTISLPAFSGRAPEFDLNPPSNSFTWLEIDYDSALLDKITADLLNDLSNGGYGINTNDETAIWHRAREREDAKARADEESLRSDFAGRGFCIPPGALIAATNRLRQSVRESINGLSRETAIKRYDQFFEARKLALQLGMSVEQMLITYHAGKMERALNFARSFAEVSISVYNASLATYNARLEAFKTEAQSFEILLRAEVEKVNVFRAQLEGVKVQTEVDRSRVLLYQAQLQGIEIASKIYSERMNAAKIYSDIEALKITSFKARIDAYIAQINASEAQVRLYDAQVRGQASLVQTFSAEVAAYEAQVKGETAKAQVIGEAIKADAAKVNAYEAQIRGELARLEAFKGQVAVFDAQVRGAETKTRGVTEAIRADAAMVSAYESEIRAELGRVEAFRAEVQAYEAKTRATQVKAQGYSDLAKASAAVSEATLANQRVKLEGYRAEVQGESDRVNASARIFEARSRATEGYARIMTEIGMNYVTKTRNDMQDKFEKVKINMDSTRLQFEEAFKNRDVRIAAGQWESGVWSKIAGEALASMDAVVAQVKEE